MKKSSTILTITGLFLGFAITVTPFAQAAEKKSVFQTVVNAVTSATARIVKSGTKPAPAPSSTPTTIPTPSSPSATPEVTPPSSTAYPDLIPDSVTFDPTYGFVIPTIKNQGKEAKNSFRVRVRWLRANGSPTGNVSYLSFAGNIMSGQKRTFSPDSTVRPEWQPPTDAVKVEILANLYQEIFEGPNQNNNLRTFERTVPDLIVENVIFDSTDGHPVVTIKNQSNTIIPSNAGIQVTARWLRGNNDITGTASVISLSGLEAQQSKTVSFSNKIPPVNATKVKITVDEPGTILETNNSNNEKISDRPDLPDLMVKNISFDTKGYSIVTVQNVGKTRVASNFKVEQSWIKNDLSYTGTKAEFVFPNAMAPGETQTFPTAGLSNPPANWLPPTNAESVVIKVDPHYDIAETNTNNNNKIEARTLPDLILDSIVYDTNSGVALPVIKNNGNGNITESNSFNVRLEWLNSDDRVINPRQSVMYGFTGQTIAPNQTVSADPIQATRAGQVLSEFIPPSHAAKIRVTIDVFKNINESNKENNILIQARSNFPDLIVDSVTFDPLYSYPTVVIKNQGTGTVTGSYKAFWEWLRSDNTSIGPPTFIEYLGNLAPGQTQSIAPQLSDTQPPYNWLPVNVANKVRIIVNPNGYYALESDKTNNWFIAERPVIASPSPSPSPSFIPTATVTPTASASPTPSQSSLPSPASKEITYPIAELGNCQDKEECKNYCEQKDNFNQCDSYSLKTGLMTEEEVEKAKKVREVSDGPGGCNNKEDCEAYCEKTANLKSCLAYASKNKLLSAPELTAAQKVATALSDSSNTPGNCRTVDECEEYCANTSNKKECFAFAAAAGLMTKDELAAAQKFVEIFDKGGPGGCTTKKECEAYCDGHPGECDSFFPDDGKDPKRDAKPICSTKEECENFCRNPANQAECKNIIIKKDTTGFSPEINGDLGALRANIERMPEQSRSCIIGAIGESDYTKIMSNESPSKPLGSDVLENCFARGVTERDQEEMLNKAIPEGEHFGDPPPPSTSDEWQTTDTPQQNFQTDETSGNTEENNEESSKESSEASPEVQGTSKTNHLKLFIQNILNNF